MIAEELNARLQRLEAQRPAFTPTVASALESMRADLIAAEIVPALRDDGVRALLLKGRSIAGWLYDEPAERRYLDCDLIVAPQHHDRAEAALRALGFARMLGDDDTPGWRQASHCWSRGPADADIDLHRTLTGVRVSDVVLWEALASDTRTITIGQTEVEVLSPSGRALHIALHAAQHGARFPPPLRDLEHALEVVNPATWGAAADLARQLDATGAFATGLRLLPAGRVLASRLGLPASSSVEAELLASSPPPGALGWHDLAATPGGLGKARVALRKLAPTRRFMREWAPLARRGRLGLTVAYAWRPVWVLLQAIPGLAACLTARRAVRAGASRR
jgi:Uncharacterised nucleotidyltransferase